MNKYLPLLLVLSVLTSAIDVDITVPSFPDISNYFNISDNLTQSTIAINFLGFCISSFFWGPISDVMGRRKILLIGNFIMSLGALGCYISTDIYFLLFCRFIQGFGASSSVVVAFAIIADKYNSQDSTRLVATMNYMATICMSIAPILGSIINEYFSWRGNYLFILIISLIALISLYIFLEETNNNKKIISTKQIFLDFKKLITSKKFLIASISSSLMAAGWMNFVACASFLYTETYGLSLLSYAMHQGVIIGIYSLFSYYSTWIIKFFGIIRSIIYSSIIIMFSGVSLILTSIANFHMEYMTSLSLIIYEIGCAILFPIIFAKALEIFPDIKGTASSAVTAIRSLICAITVALTSYYYSGELITVALVILIGNIIIILSSATLLKIVNFDNDN